MYTNSHKTKGLLWSRVGSSPCWGLFTFLDNLIELEPSLGSLTAMETMESGEQHCSFQQDPSRGSGDIRGFDLSSVTATHSWWTGCS